MAAYAAEEHRILTKPEAVAPSRVRQIGKKLMKKRYGFAAALGGVGVMTAHRAMERDNRQKRAQEMEHQLKSNSQ